MYSVWWWCYEKYNICSWFGSCVIHRPRNWWLGSARVFKCLFTQFKVLLEFRQKSLYRKLSLLSTPCYCAYIIYFCEPDLDRLESMWSPDILGEMVATNNDIMQEVWVWDNGQYSSSWAAAVNTKALDQSRQLLLALVGLTSITCPNVCGRGCVPYKYILSFLLPL